MTAGRMLADFQDSCMTLGEDSPSAAVLKLSALGTTVEARCPGGGTCGQGAGVKEWWDTTLCVDLIKEMPAHRVGSQDDDQAVSRRCRPARLRGLPGARGAEGDAVGVGATMKIGPSTFPLARRQGSGHSAMSLPSKAKFTMAADVAPETAKRRCRSGWSRRRLAPEE